MVDFDWGTLSLSFPQAEGRIKEEMEEYIKEPSESNLLDKLDRARDSTNEQEFNTTIKKLFDEVSKIQLKSLLEEDKNSYAKLIKNNEPIVRLLKNYPLSDLLNYRKLDRLTGEGAVRAQTANKVEPFNSEKLYRSYDFNPKQMEGEIEFNMRLEATKIKPSAEQLSYAIKPATNLIYTPDPKTDTFITDEKREHLENTTNVPPTFIPGTKRYSLPSILMDFPITDLPTVYGLVFHLDKAAEGNKTKPFEAKLSDQFIKIIKSLEERYIYPLQNDPTVVYNFSATGEIKNKITTSRRLTQRMKEQTGFTPSGEKEKARDTLFEIIRFYPDGTDEEGNPKFRKETEALDMKTAVALEQSAFTHFETQEKISIDDYQKLSEEEQTNYRPSFILSQGEGASPELVQSYADNPFLKPLTESEEEAFLGSVENLKEKYEDIREFGKKKPSKQAVVEEKLEESLANAQILITIQVKELGRFRLGRFKRNLAEGMEDKIYKYKSRFFNLKKKVGA
tara:strand:- start:200 stop:1723 length:1524 start_codon:yes stop_codon:yes gene_type:complete